MEARGVVVTGLGVVSAAGLGHGALMEPLATGRSCITPLPAIDDLSFSSAAQVREDLGDERADRVSRMAMRAAEQAVREAGLVPNARVAVIIGTAGGGLETVDQAYQQVFLEKRRRPSPYTVPSGAPSAPAGAVAAKLSCTGLTFGVTSACASGLHAIGLGASLIRHGVADAAIVGGAEAPLALGHLRAWDGLRTISRDACRPFSRDRSGTILGEGAAVLVLEAADRAHGRPWAEVAGFGASSGGDDPTAPSEMSFIAAMQRALDDARVSREDIGYVHAHGNGTLLSDEAEARAIRALLSERVPVSSVKGMLGHTLGASGALSVAATLVALREGFFPPTVGFRERDPACDIDIVPSTGRRGAFSLALCNSFAFGDLNASLVLRACTS